MKTMKHVVAKPRSQTIVARALGVTPQAVQLWVAQGWAPLERAVQIEKLFGIPAANIINPIQRKVLLSLISEQQQQQQ